MVEELPWEERRFEGREGEKEAVAEGRARNCKRRGRRVVVSEQSLSIEAKSRASHLRTRSLSGIRNEKGRRRKGRMVVRGDLDSISAQRALDFSRARPFLLPSRQLPLFKSSTRSS